MSVPEICDRLQLKISVKESILSKVASCRTYASLQKISSFTVIFSISGKPTFLERLHWLFIPLLFFLFSHLAQ